MFTPRDVTSQAAGKTIVVVVPSHGIRYVQHPLWGKMKAEVRGPHAHVHVHAIGITHMYMSCMPCTHLGPHAHDMRMHMHMHMHMCIHVHTCACTMCLRGRQIYHANVYLAGWRAQHVHICTMQVAVALPSPPCSDKDAAILQWDSAAQP